MKVSLYSGETPKPSRVPQAQLPTTHPMQQTWDTNTARATQNAYNLEELVADRFDFIREQQLDAEQKQLNADLKVHLDQALSLANGAPGSLFKKDGKPDTAAIHNLTTKYQARTNNFNTGFYSPQAQDAATFARAAVSANIANTIRATITSSLKPRALAAFKNNYNLSIAHGDTEGAIAAAHNCYDSGYLDESELALYTIEAQEKGVDYQLDNLSSFEQADSLIQNKDFYNACTPAQQRNLLRARKEYATQSTPPAVVLKPGAKTGSTNPQDYQRTASLPPAGIPYYMEDIWEQAGGNFSEKNTNARALVASNLLRWAADSLDPDDPNNSEREAVFRIQAKAFGMTAESITAALKEARSALQDTTAPNFQKAIDAIPTQAISPIYNDNWINNRAAAGIKETKEQAIEQFFLRHTSQAEYKNYKESGLDINKYIEARAKATRSLIASEYTSWLSSGTNSRADYETKLGQLNKIITKYTTNKGRAIALKAMQPYLNIAQQQELERISEAEQLKHKQTINAAVSQGRAYARRDLATRSSATELQPLTYTPEASAALPYSDQAAIVYVPKGYTKLGKAGQVELVNPATGQLNQVTLMEVDGIDHPHLSAVLYKHCGIYNYDQPPTLNITHQHGKIFIVRKDFDPSAPEPQNEQSEISPTNQLFPDDGLVPESEYEYSEEEAMPMSELPLA